MSAVFEQCRWLDLPIRCSHCGNRGEPEGGWEANARTPFKLIEEVVRSWEFTAECEASTLVLHAHAIDEVIDAESGTNLRIECMQCFRTFQIPEGTQVLIE